jgi:hypothetical protein
LGIAVLRGEAFGVEGGLEDLEVLRGNASTLKAPTP